MSYEKARSFTFGNDFTFATIVSADSSLRPLTYRKWFMEKRDDEEVFDFVYRATLNIIEGNIHLPKYHYINYVIDQVYKSWGNEAPRYYISRRSFDDTPEGQKQYEDLLRLQTMMYNEIVIDIIKGTFEKEYKEEKKKSYVLLKYGGNGSIQNLNRITKINKRSFEYYGSGEPFRINGILATIDHYRFESIYKAHFFTLVDYEIFKDKRKLEQWAIERQKIVGW